MVAADPQPAPRLPPGPGPGVPVALFLAAADIDGSAVIESRGTVVIGGFEYFAEPSHPGRIAWYEAFGAPGDGGNTLLSAHLNYFGYPAPTPFAQLARAAVGDEVTLSLADGRLRSYAVTSVALYEESLLAAIMFSVVFPLLPPDTERLTLITCGGDFIPSSPGGPGVYDSRLVVVAERRRH